MQLTKKQKTKKKKLKKKKEEEFKAIHGPQTIQGQLY